MTPKFRYWFCKDVYNSSQIKQLNKLINKEIKKGRLEGSDNPARLATKTSKVHIVDYAPLRHALMPFEKNAFFANEMNFNYTLYPISNKNVNYNIYNPGTEYTWHVDKDVTAQYDMKLTCLLNLSEKPFKGGEFLIFEGVEYVVEELDKPGSMIIFPSFMNHKVNPIKSGQRRTLTLWLNGPKFQ